jgi:phosphatidate cytidylyltransferase
MHLKNEGPDRTDPTQIENPIGKTKMNSAYSTLPKRVAVAVFGIPVVLGSLYAGRLALPILITIVQVFSLWEWYGLSKRKGLSPVVWPGLLCPPFLNAAWYFGGGAAAAWVACGFLFFSLLVELFHGKPGAIANASVSIVGFFYIALFSFFIPIRELPARTGWPYGAGGWILLMTILTIWVCDTAAYFVGSSFGRHKLFTRVSPKKTWEGAIAGFVSAPLISWFIQNRTLPMLKAGDAVLIGLLIGVFSQLGDLTESIFKRDAGVKDSSNLLPGHGGMLDRFDAPIMVAPVVYAYLQWFVL